MHLEKIQNPVPKFNIVSHCVLVQLARIEGADGHGIVGQVISHRYHVQPRRRGKMARQRLNTLQMCHRTGRYCLR